MTRMLSVILAALVLCTGLSGCGKSDPEDAQMQQRRTPPAQTRKPPGAMSSGDLTGEAGPGETPPPPPSGSKD